MNDEDTLTPLDRLRWPRNNIIHRYSVIVVSKQTESENETRHTESRNSGLGTGTKNAAGLNFRR